MDCLAVRTDGEFGWIAVGDPLFPTEGLHGRARYRALHDFVFFHIMGKLFVVTIVEIRLPFLGQRTAGTIQ